MANNAVVLGGVVAIGGLLFFLTQGKKGIKNGVGNGRPLLVASNSPTIT